MERTVWRGQEPSTSHRPHTRRPPSLLTTLPGEHQSRKVIEDNVTEMQAQDVIEPTHSEWSSPVVLAPKSDGSLRFCIECRRLNALTVKDSYPLPRTHECLDSLGNALNFSTLDCNWWYCQIPVATKGRPKTAFTSHAGYFHFKRMLFGFCNALTTFQRTLDILLAVLRWRSCLVYLDDVTIFSKNF